MSRSHQNPRKKAMTRAEAIARFDQLLEWKTTAIATGRCPLCGVEPEDAGLAPQGWIDSAVAAGADIPATGQMRGMVLTHEDDCELATLASQATHLSNRFKIRSETVYITIEIDGKPTKAQTLRRLPD